MRSKPVLFGMACMAGYAFFQSMVWVLVRYLSVDYPPELLVFYRNLFGAVAVAPILWRARKQGFRMQAPKLQLMRGTVACVGVYSLFYAVTAAPLAQVTAITYGAPIFAGVIAVLVLREKAGMNQLLGFCLGFLGMLVVVSPFGAGGQGGASGLLAALVGAVMTAGAFLSVKLLGAREAPHMVVAGQFLMLLPVSFLVALPRWQLPDIEALGLLILMGGGFTMAQAAMARAFASADAVHILPVDYLRLVIASGAGMLLFDEVPDPTVWGGAALIIVATLLTAYQRSRPAGEASR